MKQDLEKVYAAGYISKSEYEASSAKLDSEKQTVQTKIKYAVSKGIQFIYPPRLSDEKIKRGEEFMMACAPFMMSTNQGLLKFRANAYGVINDKYFTEKGEFEKALAELGGPEKFGLPVTAKK